MRLSDEARRRIWDINSAGRMILDWTAKASSADYAGSPLLRAAVEREFIIIGEALRAALLSEGAITTMISDVATVIAFRNVLVHNYSAINSDEVWAMIHDDLPVLLSQCRSLLGELPA